MMAVVVWEAEMVVRVAVVWAVVLVVMEMEVAMEPMVAVMELVEGWVRWWPG